MEIRAPFGYFATSSVNDKMTLQQVSYFLKEYGPVISFLIIQILFYAWFGTFFS